MKILIVGGGGREHALAWRLSLSDAEPELFCAPGNAGIAQLATCVAIAATDIERLLDFAVKNKIDLTVVGPEAPLCAGIVDSFQKRGLAIFGPTAAAAALEGRKDLAKDIMARHGIPTANHRTFSAPESAMAYVADAVDYPMVIKASGLAAGKGVVIAKNKEEAEATIQSMMVERVFGSAGDCVVVEDFLSGQEVSVMALTDGKTILLLDAAQDHKRAFDGDEGPNTGGMGAYSPTPVMTPELSQRVVAEVLVPVVHAMKQEKRAFSGVLYAGLMLTSRGPKVLEFNARFGDPECEVIMARFRGDLARTLMLCAKGKLQEAEVDWDPRPAVTVIMAQNGYPGTPAPGTIITGIDKAEEIPDVHVFHCGTRDDEGRVRAAGGRVLAVTALGADLADAVARAYRAIDAIDFPESFHRRDIAHRALGASHRASHEQDDGADSTN